MSGSIVVLEKKSAQNTNYLYFTVFVVELTYLQSRFK